MQIAELENSITQLQNELDGEQEENAQLKADLERALSDYQSKEQVWLDQKDSMSIVSVSDAVLFGFSSLRLRDDGMEIINRIASVAADYPDRKIYIQGHTDNKQIKHDYRDRFPSNWEFSSARACAVLHYIQKNHNIAPERLVAVGYGEFDPIAENDTDEGRAKNRRVVIAIGPKK
jgi:chemotaxis protein MotB